MYKYRYHVTDNVPETFGKICNTYIFSTSTKHLEFPITNFNTLWEMTKYLKSPVKYIEANADDYIQRIIEDAVQDYLNNHDGENQKWPLTFILFNIHGKFLGQCLVRQETRYFVNEPFQRSVK